ncbi:MAG TPA: hypothetical protein PLY05_06495 [Agitococcus sp.]|nr:hypothetical protein [Agitococcus sp.]HNB19357.1 hypothetical protein [Agitococcus sp.]HNC02990.1 hypothetical protein [Agitococcus sp.]
MKLPLKTLCLAIAIVNMQSAFALESLDDETMSETTGEGIALLPENYSFMMNGANPSTGLYTDNSGAGTYGTGYMRFIPVGPLTTTATNNGYQKADAWLYGVTLGQSKKAYGATIDSTDWGVPFGAISATPAATDFGRTITSWGTAENPWVVKTVTDNTVPNFTGTTKSVTYLGLEAPLYNTAAISSLSASEQSAYNLKLGYWMDVFMRNAAVADSGTTAELSNRLRLAFAWNGFSMNGSNFKIFQTLDGATAGGTYSATLKINGTDTLKTFNKGLSTSYNQTFGMAGLLRFNSVPTDARRGTVSNQTNTRQIIRLDYNPLSNYDVNSNTRSGNYFENGILQTTSGSIASAAAEGTNTTAGITETYQPMTETSLRGPAGQTPPYQASYPGTFPNGGVCTDPDAIPNVGSGNDQYGQCVSNEGYTTRRFKAFGYNDWAPPSERSVMRISTRELGTAFAGTPALGGATGGVPNFQPGATAEGLFFYDVNINLVLGNLYQPIMLSTDGNNFSFEMARIPNVSSIYTKIYTRYPGDLGDPGVTYEGSTCNIYQCGTHPVGTNTTISGNYQASTATHSSITIGATERVNSKVVNSITYNNVNQIEAHKGVGAYGISIGELKSGSGIYSESVVDYTQVWLRTRAHNYCGAFCGSSFGAWGAWQAQSPKTATTSTLHPSLDRPEPYETVQRQNYNNQILGIQTTMPVGTMASTLNAMGSPGGSVNNNFGSAVIDGLLIQHLKFSTTGL